MKPSVKLISWTQNPVETIYVLWEASRKQGPILSVERVGVAMRDSEDFKKEVRGLFLKVLASSIPVSENLNFTFLLEDISIAFREQMVRHRVGVKVGERLGVDLFPDIHDSTWWCQSMRVLDMGTFASDEAYEIPASVEANSLALATMQLAMDNCQKAYQELTAMGIPAEDARMVIPLATQHRISWTLNLATLSHIIQKRSCWILQLGFWGPIIEGMIQQLVDGVDPIFSVLATPPCMRGDTFKGCSFELDNEKRLAGEDPLPPCALWFHQRPTPNKFSDEILVEGRPDFQAMCERYETFWRRDVKTGKARG